MNFGIRANVDLNLSLNLINSVTLGELLFFTLQSPQLLSGLLWELNTIIYSSTWDKAWRVNVQ